LIHFYKRKDTELWVECELISGRMSVLGIDEKLRRSFNKLKSYGGDQQHIPEPSHAADEDPLGMGILLQTFLHHWHNCKETITRHRNQTTQVVEGSLQDDILNVSAQLGQMIELLKYESTICASSSILDYILSENVLGEISDWTECLPSQSTECLLNLEMQMFEFLILDKQRGISLLSHQTVLRPLISLLELCEDLATSSRCNYSEELLLALVHSLSIIIMEEPHLIQLFLSSNQSKKMILFSLLIPYLHKPGNMGQRAKESVLIYISMSCTNQVVEGVIGDSNFCMILATGLSALFSALPSNLDFDHPSWHKLEMSDCQTSPDLNCLMSSIELCSAVIQVSPPSVSCKLLELIQTGFLYPIIGPALASDSESEVIAYTAYLNLLLTEITADPLAVLFIRFLLTTSVEGKYIKDILISRIKSSSQISIVTLALFETILSFNIEDVMFSLIFQYLVPCTFLLPMYRKNVGCPDPQGRAANKFLSLAPVSCDPPMTPVTPRRQHPFSAVVGAQVSPSLHSGSHSQTASPRSLDPEAAVNSRLVNYEEYLRDARQMIKTNLMDGLQWRHRYDGEDVFNHPHRTNQSSQRATDAQETIGFQLEKDPLENTVEMCDGSTGAGSLSGDSNGYLSGNWDQEAEDVTLSPEEEKEFWSAVGASDVTKARLRSVLSRIQHEDRLSLSSEDDTSNVGEDAAMALGGYSSNLLLSPTLSSVSSGGQVLLGPFLTVLLDRVQQFDKNSLNFNLRLTSVVSKLATFPQSLLRCVLTHPDAVLQPTCTTLMQAICVVRVRIDSTMPGLLGAEDGVRLAKQFLHSRINCDRGGSSLSMTSLPATLGEYSRRGSRLLGFLGMRTGGGGSGQGSGSSPSKYTLTIPAHTHRMAMSAVLLEEWLQELAAIAEAHTLLEQQAAIMR